MKFRARYLVWPVAIAAVTVWMVQAFQPTPVLVDVGTVAREALVVAVEDDGRTRVRERYVVHAPVRAFLERTVLDAGDPVKAGETVVAAFIPLRSTPLDARARTDAEARLARARAAVDERRAQHEQVAAELELAESTLRRVNELIAQGIVPPTDLETAESAARVRREGLRAAEAAWHVAEFEVAVAAAALVEDGPRARDHESEGPDPDRTIVLHSPVDGAVLRVFEDSARAVEAGTPLLEVGDVRDLEIVADLLSQDAARIRPGMRAVASGFRGSRGAATAATFEAVVRVVGPSGYTKISALGVEEQRVDVVLDPVGESDARKELGDGYRVDVNIEVWRGEDLRVVPVGALFPHGDGDAAFVVDAENRARLRPVHIGRRTGLAAEVLEGLEVGTRVVMYPSALVDDGSLIAPR